MTSASAKLSGFRSLKERNAAIIEFYESGMSLRQVSAEVDIGFERVRQILLDAGVEIAPPHLPRRLTFGQ